MFGLCGIFYLNTRIIFFAWRKIQSMVKCNSEYLMDSANNRDVIKCYCSSNSTLYLFTFREQLTWWWLPQCVRNLIEVYVRNFILLFDTNSVAKILQVYLPLYFLGFRPKLGKPFHNWQWYVAVRYILRFNRQIHPSWGRFVSQYF